MVKGQGRFSSTDRKRGKGQIISQFNQNINFVLFSFSFLIFRLQKLNLIFKLYYFLSKNFDQVISSLSKDPRSKIIQIISRRKLPIDTRMKLVDQRTYQRIYPRIGYSLYLDLSRFSSS